MWERTLQDLIRGLRANKGDQNKFVQRAIDEIRIEIKSKDMHLKAGAVLKLTYLDMMGYDMSWASFYVVEVMSSPRYHLKNIGHLAACQSFTPQTDVLMLTTNLLKKDLTATPADLALTLNTLSHILTPDLARDLGHDLVTLLTHSRAHVRKRAVVAVYNVCEQYPEMQPQAFAKLRTMLEDPDPGVVVATVNVITEMARRDPAAYLNLAPQLFHILTTSSNNWVLIKVMKLFASLAPLEPRLAKKLQAPMSDLIATTTAVSLLYECVRTCIVGGMLSGPTGHSLARSCVDKLAAFLQNEDQNLKYIALLALLKLVPSHPHMVAEYEEMIMASIDEPDISIRMRALDLVSAMATPQNFQSLVSRLLAHLVPATSPLPSAASALAAVQSPAPQTPASMSPNLTLSYRTHLTNLILSLGSRELYSLVSDFHWYLSVLTDLTYVSSAPGVGEEIARQMVDVCVRVKATRRFGVELMTRLLSDEGMLLRAKDEDSCSEALGAAAWICGEYCRESSDLKTLIYYLVRSSISALPNRLLILYLHNALKVYGYWVAQLADRWDESDLQEVQRVVDMIASGLQPFISSEDIEVQERAANALQLFTFIRADLSAHKQPSASSSSAPQPSDAGEPSYPKSLFLIRPLFSAYELNAVATAAQASVPMPDGLDLDAWIVPPRRDAFDEEDEDVVRHGVSGKKGKQRDPGHGQKGAKRKKNSKKLPEDVAPAGETAEERQERERKRAERLERLRDDPYYIVDDRPSSSGTKPQGYDIDSIPVVRLDGISVPPVLPSAATAPPRSPSPYRPAYQPISKPVIERDGEMPEGAKPASAPSKAPRPPDLPVQKPTLLEGGLPPPISAFPPYEPLDEGVSTPEPIRVTRAKKGTKKRKKVANDA